MSELYPALVIGYHGEHRSIRRTSTYYETEDAARYVYGDAFLCLDYDNPIRLLSDQQILFEAKQR